MSDAAENLCARAQAGDYCAASELITLHYERLYGWLRRLTGHDEDAADLTQKTFAKVWNALGSYQRRSSFSTWLHGIGYHVYQDWLRQREPCSAQADTWWEACADEGPGPFENAAERDAAHHLYSLVEQLEQDLRATVHLHYYEGLSLAETADVMGVATSTVKYRLREAVTQLKARSEKSRSIIS